MAFFHAEKSVFYSHKHPLCNFEDNCCNYCAKSHTKIQHRGWWCEWYWIWHNWMGWSVCRMLKGWKESSVSAREKRLYSAERAYLWPKLRGTRTQRIQQERIQSKSSPQHARLCGCQSCKSSLKIYSRHKATICKFPHKAHKANFLIISKSSVKLYYSAQFIVAFFVCLSHSQKKKYKRRKLCGGEGGYV